MKHAAALLLTMLFAACAAAVKTEPAEKAKCDAGLAEKCSV